MIDFVNVGTMLGGIGLFLLGMWLMTDGLKMAAGPALQNILIHSTKTRIRGLASGVLVTALVQSSSAVTVATIGFVNAGLLTLGQSMWVLFGANVGTTMTGWLVALVGLKFKIEILALPLIGVGMALRLSGEGKRRGALGLALAGFGVLFLGIDMLRESFSGFSEDFSLPEGEGITVTLVQVLTGILLTVVMQSSSASLTIALTAAQGGLLSAQGAAAVVIGANVGTTVTALIAAIGATPNSKRVASAHILFNILTGVVALALLPWMVSAIGTVGNALELDAAPAAKLALFHTSFNLLGVALIWPVADRMARYLETLFRKTEDDEARPRYLDNNIATVPALALEALEREVRRIGEIALQMIREAMVGGIRHEMVRHQQVVAKLNQAVADFISRLNQAGMSQDSAQRLPHILRVARYYEAASELAVEAVDASAINLPLPKLAEVNDRFIDQVMKLTFRIDHCNQEEYAKDVDSGMQDMETNYQILKEELLKEGAFGRLPVSDMDARLRAASAIRRAVQQAVKAARLLDDELPENALDQTTAHE